MANIQTIRRHIKSVKNINQITEAMEMVAASKLRRAQEATFRSRTYAIDAREALARLRYHTHASDHPLFQSRKGQRQLVVAVTSDRGLAGTYNANVVKAVQALATAHAEPLKVVVIGRKGAQLLQKMGGNIQLLNTYEDWPYKPTITDIEPIAKTIIDTFTAHTIDKVTLLYTDFISLLKQEIVTLDILPIDPLKLVPKRDILGNPDEDTLFEPSAREVLNFIVPRLIEIQVYQAALEASASEQAMRMMAMKNASDNAGDLIKDLTLEYNGARQAMITQELAEIAAGAEALK